MQSLQRPETNFGDVESLKFVHLQITNHGADWTVFCSNEGQRFTVSKSKFKSTDLLEIYNLFKMWSWFFIIINVILPSSELPVKNCRLSKRHPYAERKLHLNKTA